MVRDCYSCRYKKIFMFDAPCKSCHIKQGRPKWEKKEMTKTCDNCIYSDGNDRQCDYCSASNNWGPKEQEKLTRCCGDCKHTLVGINGTPCHMCNNIEGKPKWEPKEMFEECANCKHEKTDVHNNPCRNCRNSSGGLGWEPKEKEVKEPDYSFNQGIIDALRDDKTVWYNTHDNNWEKIELRSMYFVDSKNIINGKWSLTKPKVKVKKKVERWVAGDAIFYMEGGLNTRIVMNPIETKEFKKKIAIEWEQEE